MTATVRVFFHAGVVPAHVAGGNRTTTDSVAMLRQPYLGNALLTVDESTQASTGLAPNTTTLALVQVQPGKMVQYEVDPGNRPANVSDASPIISGNTQIELGPNWSISFREYVTG